MLLSIVIPARDELASLPELLRRCRAVGETLGEPFEILLVDDGSTDGTAEWLRENAPPEVRHLRHARSEGQLASLRHGMAEAKGAWVGVVDGDLQDPPEVLLALLARARGEVPPVPVFAVKAERDDPLPFLFAQWLFYKVQHAFSQMPIPPGASTCCMLPSTVARRVARVPLTYGNVASMVAALGVRAESVPYRRGPRFGGGHSRLGFDGHSRQGVFALALTGALVRAVSFSSLAGLGGVWAVAHAAGRDVATLAMVALSVLALSAVARCVHFESGLRRVLRSSSESPGNGPLGSP